jgi:acyl-CoA thioesterase I
MRVLVLLLLVLGGLRAETLVFLGDSLTAGLGLAEEEAYPALVAKDLAGRFPAWRVVNAGVSGDTTAAGLRRVAWVLKAQPTLVVVALGANDGLRGLPLERTEANLDGIITRLKAGGARVALAGMQLPTNLGVAYRSDFAAIYPRLAARHQVPLLPFLLEGVAMVPDLNQADGIHPTAAGQRRIADLVTPFVTPLLEAR